MVWSRQTLESSRITSSACGRGRSAVLPHGMPRHPQLRVHPAVPVELQQVLRGLGERIDEHLMQHRAQETFFERF